MSNDEASEKIDKAVPRAVLCFSHLRWDFVYQRPQHLLTRANRLLPVYFWEEPVFEQRESPFLAILTDESGVRILVPTLPHGLRDQEVVAVQRGLLLEYLASQGLQSLVLWYYTPMALRFSRELQGSVVVYDCMDELSAFQGAPIDLLALEQELFERADVVFAGGASLYAAKLNQHRNVHLLPSSIDQAHFGVARLPVPDPEDQALIPHPRIGFFGVLDERLDRELLRALAARHSSWHFVLLGPVVKIRQDELPVAENLHYLGMKRYAQLPQYLAGWSVAMLPFAQNASTRFISPTKTPEYLAAGKPVVSTPIADVVRPYGELGFVKIAADAKEFGEAIGACLSGEGVPDQSVVDAFLAKMSWNMTFQAMWTEIYKCINEEAATTVGPIVQGKQASCLTI